jgi:hypothetical protein
MSTRSRRLMAVAVPLGMIASGVLVWQSSYAAFTATTTNPGNTFSAGSVTLTDDHQPATVLFNASALKPGSTGSSCIKVTYNGTLAAGVRMYLKPADLTTTGTNIAPYLTVAVDEGTGNNAACSDFVLGANAYNATGSAGTTKTLADFSATKSNYATGAGAFAPTGAAQSKTYKVTYWLQDVNAAQSANATALFTWEAQNT